jgi:hypothetical protein
MLLVIVGAGASYDSSIDYPLSYSPVPIKTTDQIQVDSQRPPLANQLFDRRPDFAGAAEELPKCLTIIDELRRRPQDRSVEQALEKLREAAVGYPEGQRQLVSIRFYLQWIILRSQLRWNGAISSATTYRVLLGRIDRQMKGEEVCFVTFNYDTLLEEAFISLGKKFVTIDDYVSNSDYKVIKPHGSINWVREITSTMQVSPTYSVGVANDLIDAGDKLKPSEKYHLLAPQYDTGLPLSAVRIQGTDKYQAALPAIAIPLEKKDEYECPKEHVNALVDCISKADKLLIIGWKAAEENFMEQLAKGIRKSIPKMVVSRNRESAAKIVSRLKLTGLGEDQWSVPDNGFTSLVLSGQIEDFVKT